MMLYSHNKRTKGYFKSWLATIKPIHMNKIFCPNCYTEFQNQPDRCSCGYPFIGSDMDKYKFMSQKAKKAKTVAEGHNAADYARLILFIIGGINLLISITFIISRNSSPIYTVSFIYSILLIGLGFVSFKEPFLSLLLGFIVLLIISIITGLVDPKMLLSGLPTRLLFVSGFIYGLIKVKKAQNVLKEEKLKVN